MISWISALDPTSIPRVGSSKKRTRGRARSHFARTTFCWVPPERLPARAPSDGVLIDSLSTWAPDSRRRAASSSRPPRANRESVGSVRFSSTEASGRSPSRFRSSPTSASPEAIASAGERKGDRLLRPGRNNRPETAPLARPKSEVSRAVRPDPIRPAMPNTSPSRASSETPSKAKRPRLPGSSTRQSSTPSAAFPGALSGRG